MTSNSSSLIEQARRGHVIAIAALINRSFQKHRVQAEVQSEATRLTVILSGTAAPAPQLAARVEQGILSLKLNQFSELVVVGCRQGTDAVAWVKRFSITSTDGVELTSAKQDCLSPPSPNTASSTATVTTQKSISSITKATDTTDTQSRQYQPPQQVKSPPPSSSPPLPAPSAFSMSTKHITIGSRSPSTEKNIVGARASR